MDAPTKPFDSYSWKWLSFQPSEGLLYPPVFLGVLRALSESEGLPPSSPQLLAYLAHVQSETQTTIDLVRTPDRNLIRNSGQYWKGTTLLEPLAGEIRLTALGKKVAGGDITSGDFAALTIQQTILPNPSTYDATQLTHWEIAGLTIRPFQLILEVINALGHSIDLSAAFITPDELTKILIPAAGAKRTASEIAQNIAKFRINGDDYIIDWPNCVPRANDPRVAREFLIFLSSFDVLRRDEDDKQVKYRLDALFEAGTAFVTPQTAIVNEATSEEAAAQVQASALPSIVSRQKIMSLMQIRPGQARFRNAVMAAFGRRCVITGEEIPQILEAAHIIPVANGGADEKANSLCMRVDVHRLFDLQHLRIKSDGSVHLSEALIASTDYKKLPNKIELPSFVTDANLNWRNTYL